MPATLNINFFDAFVERPFLAETLREIKKGLSEPEEMPGDHAHLRLHRDRVIKRLIELKEAENAEKGIGQPAAAPASVVAVLEDANGNRATIEHFGDEATARESLTTLENCKNCVNCIHCVNCTNCENCFGCENCAYCVGCYCCDTCQHCNDCSDSTGLRWCVDCSNCMNLVNKKDVSNVRHSKG